MKRFFKGLLAIILVLIIAGGTGYIGYTYLYLNQSGSNSSSSHGGQAYTNAYIGSTTSQNQSSHSGMQTAAPAIDSMKTIMVNKESLERAISLLKESIAYMTLDPYAPTITDITSIKNSVQSNNTASIQSSASDTTADPASTDSQMGNMQMQGNQSSNTGTQNNSIDMTMKNMGTKYNGEKMEQLHTGLYKLAVGMQLLGYISNDLSVQAEYAAINTQDQLQHYTNHYNVTLQNKNKLNQAVTYINEAANLVNINPYVDENGMVYDKERMKNIHESIVKMAEGVASLNILGEEMTGQAIDTAAKIQNYMTAANANAIANANANANANASLASDPTNHSTSTNVFTGIFDNINVSTIINIILILFVGLFIFGLLGFISTLLKPRKDIKE